MIKLHIDSIPYKLKPTKYIAEIKSRLQKEIQPCDITLDELVNYIKNGYSISPAVMNGGASAKHWQEQQIFCVDIDNNMDKNSSQYNNNTKVLNVNEALDICKTNNILPIFYYLSFNHTDQTPKFRLCFLSDEVITDTNLRKIIVGTLIKLFPLSDRSCCNADRIFYGTNKEVFVYDRHARISVQQILNVYELPKEQKTTVVKTNCDTDLAGLKSNFDFLSYLKSRNGSIVLENNRYVQFEECEICGHKKDLVYYHDTKKAYCFHNADRTYSIIDYIMQTQNLSLNQAIEHFKYDLCGISKATSNIKQDCNVLIENNKDNLVGYLNDLKASEYSCNDKGMSQLFTDIYSEFCRYNVTAKQWYYYDGKVWVIDNEAMNTKKKAKEFADHLLMYATTLVESEKKQSLLKYAYSLQSLRVREVVIKDAQSNAFVSHDDLDKNLELFNCQNGTFNLETFDFTPHNPKDLLSKISNVIYDPNSKSEIWEKFIQDVMLGDRQKIEYLQKIMGYGITGNTCLETCFILYGATTRNGKSTLVETIAYMLGNTAGYAMTMQPQSLARKQNKDSRQASGDIARLDGCRFLNCSEFPKRMIIDVALLKQLLGRDTITARHLHEREREFVPLYKLFVNTNFLPLISDDTLFSSGRLNVISFDKHFASHEQDKTLKDKLRTIENISGIFNWCIKGLKLFYDQGAEPPPPVKLATNEYRSNSDKLGIFIDECLSKSEKNIQALDVYLAYKQWCELNGFGTENKGNFFEELRSKNIFASSGTVNGKTVRNIVTGYEIIKNEMFQFMRFY